MTETTVSTDVAAWLTGIRASSYVRIETVSLERSREWELREGRIVHRTGRYFAVTGVVGDDGTAQPLLEQREVGTLGFLRRVRAGRIELLAQGKIEPGNVGLAQLAPTMQATASNLDRVHGGRAQFLHELFGDPADSVVSCLQSEQGTRFLGKLNRNTLVSGDVADADLAPGYRWFDTTAVLDALGVDNAVNTDARSVLVSSPWHLLTTGPPFSGGPGRREDDLAEPLARSYATLRPGALEQARALVARVADAAPEVRTVDLGDLPGWSLDPAAGLTVDGPAFGVRHLAVETDARETAAWDQPIIDSHGPGRADLDLVVVDGLALVVLVARPEPGLVHAAELGPTRVAEPGSTAAGWAVDGAVVARVRQSDEGGRFYRDVTEYRIIRRPDPGNETDAVALTLGELQELLLDGGWLTNEARSALSLLLPRL